MTRKRKNVEQSDSKPEGFAGYGYSNDNGSNQWQNESYNKKSFPDKQKSKKQAKSFDSNGFYERQNNYGGDYDQQDYQPKNEISNDERGEFPKDVVNYLRGIAQVKQDEGTLDEFILEKCGQEVAGHEETLLQWTEAAVVVESVFGSSKFGAYTFLSALSKKKHKKLLDLLFGGASARSIENLLYSMTPIESIEHVNLISTFCSLLCDNWSDAVTCQPSAYLLRTIIRITSGLPKLSADKKNDNANLKPSFVNNEMKSALKEVYDQLATFAFDLQLNNIDDQNCSFVLQTAIDADMVRKDKRADGLIKKELEKKIGGKLILNGLKGKQSSRVWEKLLEACSDKTRKSIWDEAVAENIEELVEHNFANFVMQKYISNIRDPELAKDVVNKLTPITTNLLIGNNYGVAMAMAKCAVHHEDIQEVLLKKLRNVYRAQKPENKANFLFNVLTNNCYDGDEVDVNKFTFKGSLLIEELLKFSKIKTLSAGTERIKPAKFSEMACNKIGSFVLQNIISSAYISEEIKMRIVASFSDDWESLVSDIFGSRLFDKIWEYVDLKQKHEIMKKLAGVHSSSKSFKFAMLKCDLRLFRKDKKQWMANMKKVKG